MNEVNRNDRRRRTALVVSTLRITPVVALLSGLFSGLILDGQVFDHAVFGLACGRVATACGLALGRKYGRIGKPLMGAWIMAGLGLILAVVCLLGLPSAKLSQDKFNKRLEEIRQKQGR